MLLQLLLLWFGTRKVTSYPESGVHVSIAKPQKIEAKQWVIIDGWGNNDKTGSFIQDFLITSTSNFVTPRSGLYFVSLHLHFENINQEVLVNISLNNRKELISKYNSVKTRNTLHIYEILSSNVEDFLSIYVYTDEMNILQTKTVISIQYINSFTNSLGFIAYPISRHINRNEIPQTLLDWKVDFNLVNGFSKSTGTFTSVVDGYYLLVLKFVIKNIVGKFNVFLIENNIPHKIIERTYIEKRHSYDTVLYTDIRKFKKYDQLKLQILTTNKGGRILNLSKYSVVYLKPLRKEIYYKNEVKVEETVDKNMEWYRIVNWLPTTSSILKTIQIDTNGYYYVIIHLDVKSTNLELITVRFKINNNPKTIIEDTGNEGTNQFIISGVYFIKMQESVSCEIMTSIGDVIQQSSYFTIIPVAYLNYTSLFIVKSPTNSTLIQNKNLLVQNDPDIMNNEADILYGGLFLETQVLSNSVFSITEKPNKELITIKHDGNYFITLNLSPKNGSIAEVNITLLHKTEKNWNKIEKFHIDGSHSVYYSNILTLMKNEQLGLYQDILKSRCDACLDASMEILFIQPLQKSVGANIRINDSHGVSQEKVKGFSLTDRIKSIEKPVLLTANAMQIEIPGIYVITVNLAISLMVPEKINTIKVSIGLKNLNKRRETNIFETKKSVLDDDKLYFYNNFIYLLEKGQVLSIKIMYEERSPYTNKTIKGEVTFLRTQTNETAFTRLDAVFANELSGGGFINWKSKLEDAVRYYFIVILDIRAQHTIQGLVSTILNGRIVVDTPGIHYIRMSIQINKKPLYHLNTKYENFTSSHDVTLTLSGLVTLRQEDDIFVHIYLSQGLKFKLSKQTKIYIAVLEETFEHVKNLTSLQSNEIEVNSKRKFTSENMDGKDILIENSGIYQLNINLYNNKRKRRKRRSIDNMTTTAITTQSIFKSTNGQTTLDKKTKNNDKLSTRDVNKTMAPVSALSIGPTTATILTAKPIKSSKEKFRNIIIHQVTKPSIDDSDIKRLHELIDNIWTKSIINISCVNCNKQIQVLTYLEKGNLLSISTKKYDIGLTLINRDGVDFTDIKITKDQFVCQDSKSIDYIRNENVLGDMTNYFYQADNYQMVDVYATFVINDVEQLSTLWLVSNSNLDDAVELKQSNISASRNLYQVQHRVLLRRNALIQVVVKCQNMTVDVIKGSKISVYKSEDVLTDYKENIPTFDIQPYPRLNEQPVAMNYTCGLTDDALNSLIYWNKIDIYNGKETKQIAVGPSMSIDGVPEESGHYYCSVDSNKYTAESQLITFLVSDDDECLLMKAGNMTRIKACDRSSECINTIGSYYCICNEGYTGDGFNCTDINECEFKPCGNNTDCINQDGGHKCVCLSGYRGIEGENCTDINECVENGEDFCEKELSSDKALCENSPGSYECYCDVGFEKKDKTCKDINECDSDPEEYPCDDHATCNNTPGSFNCKCDPGWFGNGTHCEDVDECNDASLFSCAGNATCKNNPGTYRCICNRGFKGEGKTNCVPLGCFPPKHCQGQYSATWWARKPYIENGSRSDEAYGLFRDILTMIIIEICNNCSQIVFTPPLNSSTAVELKVEENDADFACPLYGSKEQEKFRGFPFIPLVEAPGVAFFVKEQKRENNPLLGSLAGSWPILVITLLLASLSGVIIWFLDTVRNPNEFPHSFLEGSWEGFWWAFITMTTVGYGDKAPRSFLARVFGIVWILIGLVIISTFTATITTVLTASSLSNTVKLYGTRVGALSNSEEFRLGVKRNADVIGFRTVPEIIKALNAGEIQGALLDTYIAGEFQDSLNNYKLQEILEHVFVYGLTLSRDAENLEEKFRSYIERKQSSIYAIISQVVKPLKENKASKESGGSTATLFDASSPFFSKMLIVGFVILLTLLFVGFLWDWLYWRHKGKKTKKMFNGKTPAAMHVSWQTIDIIEYQKRSFRKEVTDLKEQIMGFSEVWISRLTEMEIKHEEQLNRVQKWLGKSNLLNTIRHYPATNSAFGTFVKKEENTDFIKLYQNKTDENGSLLKNTQDS